MRLRRVIPEEPALRRLAAVTVVNTFGNGLFMTLGALYLTRMVGLSVAQVGLGLTVAGGLGVVGGIPFGQLADRVGHLRLLIVLVLAEAVGTACVTLIDSFATLLVVAGLTTLADRASSAVRNGLYAVVLSPERRTQSRAYLRAVTNVGIGAGSATAAIALQVDTRPAYVALILLDALTFVVAAWLLAGMPISEPVRAERSAEKHPRNRALRDGPYLAISGLNAVLALQFGLIEVGLPLWIVRHTDAPRAMVAGTMLLNTVLVVLLQVRASKGITTVGKAARAAGRGGLLMAAACLVFAAAHGVSMWLATVVLAVGMLVQTLSEVTCSAAGWALSYDLADPQHPGAYQGVYSSGFALATMLAPVIAAVTALRYGLLGWCVLAALFAVAGMAVRPVTAWAVRRGAQRCQAAVPVAAAR